MLLNIQSQAPPVESIDKAFTKVLQGRAFKFDKQSLASARLEILLKLSQISNEVAHSSLGTDCMGCGQLSRFKNA